MYVKNAPLNNYIELNDILSDLTHIIFVDVSKTEYKKNKKYLLLNGFSYNPEYNIYTMTNASNGKIAKLDSRILLKYKHKEFVKPEIFSVIKESNTINE